MRKNILSSALLLIVVNSYAQTTPSQTENYIFSTTCFTADCVKKAETIQYFDGLGRPKQIVNVKASPLEKDVVTHIEYDGFGRQVKDYFPVPQSGTSNGAIYGNPLSDVASTPYGNEKIYSEKVLENSPLDRVFQQIQAGNAWNNKPINFGYDTNVDGDKVLRFFTSTNWSNQDNNDLKLEASKYYGAGQLYKNKITDEDGNESEEFKNGEGKTLLVRKKLSQNEFADTYYIYNEYNQLSYVISPNTSKKIDNTLAGGVSVLHNSTNSAILDLCYQYRYDGQGRMVEKKLPGKGWEYLVYDNQDRLVMTQDANLLSSGQWLFTKYDKFGRVAYTGITTDSGSRNSLQTIFNGKGSNNVERTTTNFVQPGLLVYYDNDASKNYPNTLTKLLSVNYYDTYPTGTPTIPSSILSQAVLPQTGSLSTKSLPTASFVNNVENNGWTKNYIWYDTKGRTIGTHSINHLGGYTKTESLLDFAGVPQKIITMHKRLNGSEEVVVQEEFEYDHQNRLLKHYHEVVGKTDKVLLAENHYNEIGQLDQKKVGADQYGSSPLQTVDYSYNIRGWLTQINDPTDLGDHLFAYKIKYENPDNESLAPKRYNGNISEIDWIYQNGSLKRYGYQYDNLNRLLRGNYQDPENSLPESHINDEALTYDLNGNITNLVRNAKHSKFHTPIVIDNLGYTYNGNRVTNIDDASGNSSGYEGGNQTITYDDNGNMTAMPDKGISAIAYNFLNLPTEIDQNANVTNYYYRADGVKIKKKYKLINNLGTNYIYTEYLDGFQYSTPNTEPIRRALEETDDATVAVSTAGEEEAFIPLDEREIAVDTGTPEADNVVLSFFPTAEGYYDYENNRYIYQYKDHLGNVRISYVKENNALKIMDTNEYYPFGMSFLKPNAPTMYDPMAIPYNYKYSSQELQETGFYDFGNRQYMPDIGRWFKVDELAETSRRWSPYAYAYNNPMRFVDPDGRQNEDWVKRTGMSNWEYRSDITSAQQAKDAGFASYADGRGDANSTYTTTLSRNGVDTGVEQTVVLGEGGNYTVNGESFVAPDHYTDMTPVDQFGKFMAGFVAFPMLIEAIPGMIAGGSAEALFGKALISATTQLGTSGDIDAYDLVGDTFLTPGASNVLGGVADYNIISGEHNIYGITGNKSAAAVATDLAVGGAANKVSGGAGRAFGGMTQTPSTRVGANMTEAAIQTTKGFVNQGVKNVVDKKK
ncbi:MAG: DUF6443 domain-containing protein [Bergeyella sp.]